METIKRITQKEYMSNSNELHHDYYLQFATRATKRYVLSELTVEQIKDSLNNGDDHLNNIKIPFNNMGSGGNWWWNFAPINTTLLKELGGTNSHSTHTCVAKAIAKELTKNL